MDSSDANESTKQEWERQRRWLEYREDLLRRAADPEHAAQTESGGSPPETAEELNSWLSPLPPRLDEGKYQLVVAAGESIEVRYVRHLETIVSIVAELLPGQTLYLRDCTVKCPQKNYVDQCVEQAEWGHGDERHGLHRLPFKGVPMFRHHPACATGFFVRLAEG